MVDRGATSSWVTDAVERTVAGLAAVADPAGAGPMRAYMKDVAPFLGVKTPARTAAQRQAWNGLTVPTEAELADAARALWARPEREHQYAACDLIDRFRRRVCRPAFLTGTVQDLITTKSWWDTVDSLRACAVGPLMAEHPDREVVIERWSESGNRWLVRSAIIHQLAYKGGTDERLLFALCRRHGGDREFFVAKAIGWALRQYAYTAPDAVRTFVGDTPLQPLSVREATKHLH